MQELEHRGAALEDVEQPLAGVELLAVDVAEQACRAADVEIGRLGDEIVERRPEDREEQPLSRPEPGILERAAQDGEARALPYDGLVEIGGRPLDEAGIDLLLQLEDPFRDAPRRRDHDGEHDPRLKLQHLHVEHGRGLERRRRDDREQVRRVRERLGRAPQCLLELVPRIARRSMLNGPGRPSTATTSSSV